FVEEPPDDALRSHHLVVQERRVRAADAFRRSRETYLEQVSNASHRSGAGPPHRAVLDHLLHCGGHAGSLDARVTADGDVEQEHERRHREQDCEDAPAGHRRARDTSRVVARVRTTRYTMRAGSRTTWK